MNLFVGSNNSGKSAVLKALDFPLKDNPHKNPKLFRGAALPKSLVEIDLRSTMQEIIEKLNNVGQRANFPAGDGSQTYMNEFSEIISSKDSEIDLELTRLPGQPTAPRSNSSIVKLRNNNQVFMECRIQDGEIVIEGRGSGNDSIPSIFTGEDSESYFYFDAQRLNVGRSGLNTPRRLRADAANLAAVLAYLQGSRRPVFDKIERHVIDIIGGVGRITITPRDNLFEIMIWPDRSSEYEELAFGLDDCGTGLGQLLAIITAMVTSEQSVIIIDEINTFLHPSAVKKLISLMRSSYSHHQYVLSTHSSDVIGSSSAEKIYLVSKIGFDSFVEEVSLSDANKAREISSVLGFSMMDVFGRERIIWVEGPTEEICFPLLCSHFDIDVGSSTSFASVFSTSSFTDKKGARRDIIGVYELAGKQLSPLLKGMAFALDREKLSDEEIAKFEKSRRKLRFLPRRCLENFVLHPEAISMTLSRLDGRHFSSQDILDWIVGNADLEKYGARSKWSGDIFGVEWLKIVDVPRLLSDLFSKFTDFRVEFRKTRDTPTLMANLLEVDPDRLTDVRNFLEKVVDISRRDTSP